MVYAITKLVVCGRRGSIGGNLIGQPRGGGLPPNTSNWLANTNRSFLLNCTVIVITYNRQCLQEHLPLFQFLYINSCEISPLYPDEAHVNGGTFPNSFKRAYYRTLVNPALKLDK